ncbi:MAG TPA: hypothetical protein VNN20_01515 [Thermodesulfobacteriota bacterium]|nr:hypothetical protein [Thermodesulfobacteriota bacterium]
MKRFILGLSPGKAEGHAAIALVETFGKYRINKRYNLRRVERFKFKSDDDIVNRIIEFLDNDQLKENLDLIADTTVCGQKLIDSLIKAKLNPVAVTMIDEGTATSNDVDRVLLKKELLTNLQMLYVAERLRINPQSALGRVIAEEILRFRVHKTPKNDDMGKSDKKPEYEDLIFALALACWYGQETSKEEITFSSNKRA